MADFSNDLQLIEWLADQAGNVIRPYFRGAYGLETKSDKSPVTLADRDAEAIVRKHLEKHRPADGIIGEEFGAERPGAARQWVIDPIDGTTSFAAGRPIFGTLIALMQDGWPILSVIDQPITGERWLGAVGYPTLFNGKPTKTRPCLKLSNATLATTGPHLFDDHAAAHFMELASKTSHRRMVWGGDCYNYGLLASGHIDIVAEQGLKLYDWAALVPIVEGAGGTMCDWNGEPLTPDSEGDVLALGDPARLDDVLEALHCDH